MEASNAVSALPERWATASSAADRSALPDAGLEIDFVIAAAISFVCPLSASLELLEVPLNCAWAIEGEMRSVTAGVATGAGAQAASVMTSAPTVAVGINL